MRRLAALPVLAWQLRREVEALAPAILVYVSDQAVEDVHQLRGLGPEGQQGSGTGAQRKM